MWRNMAPSGWAGFIDVLRHMQRYFNHNMWRHRCAGGLKNKLYLLSGSQRHRHFVGFFNVPVLHRHGTTLFIRWFQHTAPFSRLLRHAGDTEDVISTSTPRVLTGGGGGGRHQEIWGTWTKCERYTCTMDYRYIHIILTEYELLKYFCWRFNGLHVDTSKASVTILAHFCPEFNPPFCWRSKHQTKYDCSYQ